MRSPPRLATLGLLAAAALLAASAHAQAPRSTDRFSRRFPAAAAATAAPRLAAPAAPTPYGLNRLPGLTTTDPGVAYAVPSPQPDLLPREMPPRRTAAVYFPGLRNGQGHHCTPARSQVLAGRTRGASHR